MQRQIYETLLQNIEDDVKGLKKEAVDYKRYPTRSGLFEIGWLMHGLWDKMEKCTPPWTMEGEYTDTVMDGVMSGVQDWIIEQVSP